MWKIARDLLTVFASNGLRRVTIFGVRVLGWDELVSYSLSYPTLTLIFRKETLRISVMSIADIAELQSFLLTVSKGRTRNEFEA